MLIFVYGTLRKNQSNHALLEGAEFRGTGYTKPEYHMVSMGGYPAIFPGGTVSVYGELFEADSQMVRRMDYLEGHPHYYRRTPIILQDGVECAAYVCQEHPLDRPPIASGDWVKYLKEGWKDAA